MKLLGWLLMTAMVLALLRAAAIAASCVLGVGLLLCLIRAPKETISILFAFVLLNAFATAPRFGFAFVCICFLLAGVLPEQRK